MFTSKPQSNDLIKEQQANNNEEFRKQLQKDLIAAINAGCLVKLKGILAIPGVTFEDALNTAFRCTPINPEIIIELINAGADIQRKFFIGSLGSDVSTALKLVCFTTQDAALISLVLRKVNFLDLDNTLITSLVTWNKIQLSVLSLLLQEAVLRNDHRLIKNIFGVKSDLDCTAETLGNYLKDIQLSPAQIRHAQVGVSYMVAKHYISFEQGAELKRVIADKPAAQPAFVASFSNP